MAAQIDPDTIGPIDVATIVFEGNDFNGEVIPSLDELVKSGTVTILDLAFIKKDAEGTATILEVSDGDVADHFASLSGGQMDLLNDEDLDYIAEGLESNTSAMVVVWENTWASRFSQAVRGSHGHMTAYVRIPRENVLLALAALEEE